MAEELDTPLIKSGSMLAIIDEENQLENSPTSTISELLCRICYEENELITLKCKHQLCKQCLASLKKHECPFCRENITVTLKPSIRKPQEIDDDERECDNFCNKFVNFICLILAICAMFYGSNLI